MYSTRWPRWIAPLAYGSAEVTSMRRLDMCCLYHEPRRIGPRFAVQNLVLEPQKQRRRALAVYVHFRVVDEVRTAVLVHHRIAMNCVSPFRFLRACEVATHVF